MCANILIIMHDPFWYGQKNYLFKYYSAIRYLGVIISSILVDDSNFPYNKSTLDIKMFYENFRTFLSIIIID